MEVDQKCGDRTLLVVLCRGMSGRRRGTRRRGRRGDSDLDDYVIAVRSYARATVFPQKTYRMLAHNGLTDRLYVFVANEEELVAYEAALAGKEYRALVVGELGGAKAIRAICRYFPRGKRIVFMDDDLDRFFAAPSPTERFVGDATNLGCYLEDGFRTIDRWGLGAFTFSFMSNRMWLRGKPFKEFRPFTLAGNFFGTRNDPDMIVTEYSHGDDLVRSVRFLERYGGALVYWWAGFVTRYGKEAGGMQQSGNRGSAAATLARTGEVSWLEYRGDPLLQAYAHEPRQEAGNPFVSMRMKALPAVRRAMVERGVRLRSASWGWPGSTGCHRRWPLVPETGAEL